MQQEEAEERWHGAETRGKVATGWSGKLSTRGDDGREIREGTRKRDTSSELLLISNDNGVRWMSALVGLIDTVRWRNGTRRIPASGHSVYKEIHIAVLISYNDDKVARHQRWSYALKQVSTPNIHTQIYTTTSNICARLAR